MKVILSHSGKQHSYHVAKGLEQLGVLEQFYTSSYLNKPLIRKLLFKQNKDFWGRRYQAGLSDNLVTANWSYELKETVFRKIYKNTTNTQEAVYARDEGFDIGLSKQLSKRKFDVFWGFQGSCLESVKQANTLGKRSICELATAHVLLAKRILGEEQLLHPEWADSIDNLVFPKAYEQRLEEEPIHADTVVAASSFTKYSLTEFGISADKIKVLPLGCPTEHIDASKKLKQISNRPLKLLYCGVISQRKGIKYLLESMKQFNRTDVELHIIGRIQGEGEALKNYKGLFIHHQPISQAELFKTYQEYDALVLPTLFEGFGLVIVEAMAAGLPVITTAHSIGEDLISQGENGYLVNVRSVEDLEDSIANLRSLTDEVYEVMSNKAIQTAKLYSWTRYQDNLGNFIKDLNLTLSET